MTWIVLIFAIEGGWVPHSIMIDYMNSVANEQYGMFYQEMDAYAVMFGFIRIGGSLVVYDWKSMSTVYGFFPFELLSMIYAEIRIGGFVIGVRHGCAHSVVPYQPILGTSAMWDAAGNTIYIRYESKVEW